MTINRVVGFYIAVIASVAVIGSCASDKPARRSIQALISECKVPRVEMLMSKTDVALIDLRRQHCEVEYSELFCTATMCVALRQQEEALRQMPDPKAPGQ